MNASPSNADASMSPLDLRNREALVQKQAARHYSALFSSPALPQTGDASMRFWQRPGTGILGRMIRHDQLTAEQQKAIGEYRLDQYILAGLYDDIRAAELQLTSDPNLVDLPGSTIHLLVGDAEHHLLCYASFEPAHIPPLLERANDSTPVELSGSLEISSGYLMREVKRPVFSVEFAFGPEVYASHPDILSLPVTAVCEMMRMIRNQAIRVPLSSMTSLEVMVAASYLFRHPETRFQALIGCASPELRQLSHRLHVPIAYAPNALDHLREHSTSSHGAIWTAKALEPGRFWPLAIALEDIQVTGTFFDQLDAALNEPDVEHVMSAYQEVERSHSQDITSRYCYNPPADKPNALAWVPYATTKQARF
jgi:hypothetical protein